MSKYSMHLLVCGGTGCKSQESDTIAAMLKKELSKQGLEDTVQVIKTGCFGFCEKGPIVKVMPDNTFYTQVKPEDAEEIVDLDDDKKASMVSNLMVVLCGDKDPTPIVNTGTLHH